MRKRVLISAVAAAAVAVGTALAQTGGGFDLSWFSVDGGGGASSGSGYTLTGSIGQPDASSGLSGGGFTLTSGFLAAALPAQATTTPTATPLPGTPSPTPTPTPVPNTPTPTPLPDTPTPTPVVGTATPSPVPGTELESVQIPLVSGFNLIALPVGCAVPMNAKQLTDLVSTQGLSNAVTVDSVQRWGVGGAQGFDGWLPGSPNPFLIEPGQGYFVKVSGAPSGFSVSVTGQPCTQSTPLDFLVAGFNLIGVPFSSRAGGHDAKTLSDLIEGAGGVVNSVQRWGVGGSQAFDGWLPEAPNPFPIDPKAGYFVKVSAAPTASVQP